MAFSVSNFGQYGHIQDNHLQGHPHTPQDIQRRITITNSISVCQLEEIKEDTPSALLTL